MHKKNVTRKRITSSKKKHGNSHRVVGISIVSLGIVALFGFAYFTFNSTHVLGAKTLLARGGDDIGGESGGGDHGGSNSGDGNSNSGGGSGSSNNSGQSSGGGNSGSGNTSGSTNQNVSGGTSVNCTGPDGKVFQTSVSYCENLNKQWNHPVSYTIVIAPKHKLIPNASHAENETIPHPSGLDTQEDKNIETGIHPANEAEISQYPVEVESKDQQVMVNLKKHGTVIELRKNQGRIELQAKQEDGSFVELGDDSLKTVNDELEKENESEIEQDALGKFVLKHGSTRAKTDLPISINLVTKELTVTTSKGAKIVAVLPDAAVDKLLTLKVIDRLEEETNDIVSLTEVNNKPVFVVRGIDSQKLGGFVSVEIHKSVDVSAETGIVEATHQSFGQRLLDLLSI